MNKALFAQKGRPLKFRGRWKEKYRVKAEENKQKKKSCEDIYCSIIPYVANFKFTVLIMVLLSVTLSKNILKDNCSFVSKMNKSCKHFRVILLENGIVCCARNVILKFKVIIFSKCLLKSGESLN